MDFTQPIEDIVEEIAEYVIDLRIDDYAIERIVQHCRENEITTKSDFVKECNRPGIMKYYFSVLKDGAFQYIHARSIDIDYAIDILNTADGWTNWHYYFRDYGRYANDVIELAQMVLNYKFKEYGGYDVLLDNFYNYIEDYLI